jgi:Uma2 family endonuclease
MIATLPSRTQPDNALDLFDEELPYSDGEPLESAWHFWQIALLIELTNLRFAGRQDFFCGGNMFVHYSLERARNRDFRGPDYFLVRGVDRKKQRKYWASWDEGGRLPDLVVELLSPSTSAADRGEKFHIYEQVFKAREYFMCNPDTMKLEGYRLAGGRYEPIAPDPLGRLHSEVLETDLGIHEWTEDEVDEKGIRLFDEHGGLVLKSSEIVSLLRSQNKGQNTP